MHEDVMDKAVAADNLEQALRAVIRNRGAARIDRMTVDELEEHFKRHRDKIVGKLLDGRWTPSPVKRVEIPKPNGGVRKLGIPTASGSADTTSNPRSVDADIRAVVQRVELRFSTGP